MGRKGHLLSSLLGAGLAMAWEWAARQFLGSKICLPGGAGWQAGSGLPGQGEPPSLRGTGRVGGDQQALWAGAHCVWTPLGREGSVPRNRLWVFSLRGQGPFPLKGEKGQLDADPTVSPSHQWRDSLSAQPGLTLQDGRTRASCPSSGFCQAPSGPSTLKSLP